MKAGWHGDLHGNIFFWDYHMKKVWESVNIRTLRIWKIKFEIRWFWIFRKSSGFWIFFSDSDLWNFFYVIVPKKLFSIKITMPTGYNILFYQIFLNLSQKNRIFAFGVVHPRIKRYWMKTKSYFFHIWNLDTKVYLYWVTIVLMCSHPNNIQII